MLQAGALHNGPLSLVQPLLSTEMININDQISAYNVLIADKQDELDNAQVRYQELNENTKDRIRAMEEDGSLTYPYTVPENCVFVLGDYRTRATDSRLLAHLREDARLPVSQLATLLDIPRAQVYARLERLEADGIIEGYTVRLGSAFSKTRMRAHVMIKTLPRQGQAAETGLAEIAEVSAIYAISGEYDIIALVEAADSVAMNDLLDRIGMLDGVERTTTSVILATKLER